MYCQESEQLQCPDSAIVRSLACGNECSHLLDDVESYHDSGVSQFEKESKAKRRNGKAKEIEKDYASFILTEEEVQSDFITASCFVAAYPLCLY